jgi:hypothetical protein
MKKVIVAWMVGVFLASVAWAGQAADSGPQTGEGGKGQAPRPEFPQVVIANKMLKATVYLPDAEKGFYRGTRFDWSGMIAQAEYRGHTFFGELKGPHDPLIHDHTVGPCEEFGQRAPLGYAEAAGGETFVKIGIGHLRKPPNEKSYSFARSYEIVKAGPWEVEKGQDRMRFKQDLNDPRGWGYAYEKDVVLTADRPTIQLVHRFKNTGSRPIETDHYNHSMFIIDGEPIGKNYRLVYPFALSGEIRNKAQAALRGKELVFLQDRLEGNFYVELQGFGGGVEDNCVAIENTKNGAKMRLTVDQPLSLCRVYAEKTSVCPEPFVAVRLAPGEAFTWTTTVEFIVP